MTISATKATNRKSTKTLFMKGIDMKTDYDLSKLKSRKNPYASKLKRPEAA
jgi:hypothetical protein